MGMMCRRRFQIYAAYVSCVAFESQCYSDVDYQDGVYITYGSDGKLAKLSEDVSNNCVLPRRCHGDGHLHLSSCDKLFNAHVYMLPERKNQTHFEGFIRARGAYGQQRGQLCWTLSGSYIDLQTCGQFPNQIWHIFKNPLKLTTTTWEIIDNIGRRVAVQSDNRLVLVKDEPSGQSRSCLGETFLGSPLSIGHSTAIDKANRLVWLGQSSTAIVNACTGLHSNDFKFHAAYFKRILGGDYYEFYLIAVGLTICHLTFIMYILTSLQPCMLFIRLLRSWTTSQRKALWWQWFKIFPDDSHCKKARELARRMRVERSHTGLSAVMNFGLSPCLFIQLANTSRYMDVTPHRKHYGFLYCYEFLPVAILSPVVLLFCRCERFRSSRTLDCLWVLVSAVWICKYMISANHCFQFNDIVIAQCRLVFSVIVGNAKLATFLETIVTICQVSIYAVHFPCEISVRDPIDALLGNSAHSCGPQLVYYAFNSVAHLVLSLVLVWVIELATLRQALATVEANESSQNSTVATKLLGCMCDTVVHMDKDLQIVQPAPKLAAMLQRQVGTDAPLLGAKVQDFMDDESITRYEEYIEEHMTTAENNHVPRPLNVNFYDSNRIRVSTEIVCACIPDTTGSVGDFKIVIGISEVRERHMESIDALPQVNMRDPGEMNDDASSSSGSSVSEDVCLGNMDDMSFSVTISKDEVAGASTPFEEFVGSPGGIRNLRDILLDPDAFRTKVFDALDDAYIEQTASVLPIDFKMSVLRPKMSSRGYRKLRRMTFNAYSEVSIPYPFRDEPQLVRIISLQRIEKRPVRPGRRGTSHATRRDFLPLGPYRSSL